MESGISLGVQRQSARPHVQVDKVETLLDRTCPRLSKDAPLGHAHGFRRYLSGLRSVSLTTMTAVTSIRVCASERRQTEKNVSRDFLSFLFDLYGNCKVEVSVSERQQQLLKHRLNVFSEQTCNVQTLRNILNHVS